MDEAEKRKRLQQAVDRAVRQIRVAAPRRWDGYRRLVNPQVKSLTHRLNALIYPEPPTVH